MYKKTSSGLVPHYKKGKRLFFKRAELVDLISIGKQLTVADIEQRAIDYLARRQK